MSLGSSLAVQGFGLLAVTAEGLCTVPGQRSKIQIPEADQDRKKEKENEFCSQMIILFFNWGNIDLYQYASFMHPILYFYFCVLCSALTTQNLVSIHHRRAGPRPHFTLPRLPRDDACSVVCVRAFVFCLVCSFILFLLLLFIAFFYVPHMSEIIWCLSSSSLSIMPSRSMLLRMARLHPLCGWVLFRYVCVYTPHLYPPVCWWTRVVSISWLL